MTAAAAHSPADRLAGVTQPSAAAPASSAIAKNGMAVRAIVVVVAGLLVAVLALNPARPTTTSDLPAGLPPQLTQDLRGLHEAVNG